MYTLMLTTPTQPHPSHTHSATPLSHPLSHTPLTPTQPHPSHTHSAAPLLHPHPSHTHSATPLSHTLSHTPLTPPKPHPLSHTPLTPTQPHPLTIVILMLHGLLWFGLDQKLSGEPNLVLVIHSHLEKGAHVVQFSLEVSVEERLVAFSASPEH